MVGTIRGGGDSRLGGEEKTYVVGNVTATSGAWKQ